MLPRPHRSPRDSHHAVDQDFDSLILRIRRLAAHRGYDRDALLSPMLKRLIPLGKLSGDPLTDTAELRKRLTGAAPDLPLAPFAPDRFEAAHV